MAQQPAGVDIDLTDVTKRYQSGGKPIIATDAVTLHIDAGTTVALVGSSGSGKSTLLHLIGAMDAPDTGSVTVAGTALASLNRRELAAYRRGVGFVFQRFHLLAALTVEDNVLAPLIPTKPTFDRRARARELIAAVGLAGRETDLPSHLSGGEQQRVAIARALINQPRLLLADEPTGNLDSTTGTEILDLLFELHAAHQATVLLATHDPQVAARCSRLVRLQDGAVTEDTEITAQNLPQLAEQIERLQQR